jgi:hypothetical protein
LYDREMLIALLETGIKKYCSITFKLNSLVHQWL